MRKLILILAMFFASSAFGQTIAILPTVSAGANTHNSGYGAAGVTIFGMGSSGILLTEVEYEFGMYRSGFSLSVTHIGPIVVGSSMRVPGIIPVYAKASRFEDGVSSYSIGLKSNLSLGIGVQYSPTAWGESDKRKTDFFSEISFGWPI